MRFKLFIVFLQLSICNYLQSNVLHLENRYNLPVKIEVANTTADNEVHLDINQMCTIKLPSLPGMIEFIFDFGIAVFYDTTPIKGPIVRTSTFIDKEGFKAIIYDPNNILFFAP